MVDNPIKAFIISKIEAFLSIVSKYNLRIAAWAIVSGYVGTRVYFAITTYGKQFWGMIQQGTPYEYFLMFTWLLYPASAVLFTIWIVTRFFMGIGMNRKQLLKALVISIIARPILFIMFLTDLASAYHMSRLVDTLVIVIVFIWTPEKLYRKLITKIQHA